MPHELEEITLVAAWKKRNAAYLKDAQPDAVRVSYSTSWYCILR